MNDAQKIALSEGLELARGFRIIKILATTTLAESGRHAMHACAPRFCIEAHEAATVIK